jgi:hypothetical protein
MNQNVSETDDFSLFTDFRGGLRIDLIQLRQCFTEYLEAPLNCVTQLPGCQIPLEGLAVSELCNIRRRIAHIFKKLF